MNINTSGRNAFQNGFLDKVLMYMQDNLSNLTKAVSDTKDYDTEENEQNLINSIKNSIREWEIANINFENAENDEMVDYYSYQIKAAEIKYQYLLRLVKEKGINTDKLCLPSLVTHAR